MKSISINFKQAGAFLLALALMASTSMCAPAFSEPAFAGPEEQQATPSYLVETEEQTGEGEHQDTPSEEPEVESEKPEEELCEESEEPEEPEEPEEEPEIEMPESVFGLTFHIDGDLYITLEEYEEAFELALAAAIAQAIAEGLEEEDVDRGYVYRNTRNKLLFAGVSVTDQEGGEVSNVFLQSDGGFEINARPGTEFVLTFAAIHPITAEMSTAQRRAVIYGEEDEELYITFAFYEERLVIEAYELYEDVDLEAILLRGVTAVDQDGED
ncbi:MAG: hypothetical protein FWE19_04355, partial [Oscillospiraceae bacterium]|nr:hypothetical protein [Oscillospiraceae bacterium]